MGGRDDLTPLRIRTRHTYAVCYATTSFVGALQSLVHRNRAFGVRYSRTSTSQFAKFLGVETRKLRRFTRLSGCVNGRSSHRRARVRRTEDSPTVFRPKDSGDYAVRSKHNAKHELESLRRWSIALADTRACGWTAATNVHPRDLTLQRPGTEILGRAETVGRNAEFAVREAIGQLFTYRHLLYASEARRSPRSAAWHSFHHVVRPQLSNLRAVFALLAGLAPLQAERSATKGGPEETPLVPIRSPSTTQAPPARAR
jgi:hypothetical protein